jgi:phytol kinase
MVGRSALMALVGWSNPSNLWLQAAIVGTWLGMLGLTAEVLHRKGWASPEAVRKVVHIGAGNVILLAWWLQTPTWLGVAASGLFSILTFLSYHLPILPSINGVGRKSLGTFFYAVSMGILILVFWPSTPAYAALGVLIMTWGDGLAALIGQRFGKHCYKIWGMGKTWEGSLTMAGVSLGVSGAILIGQLGLSWQVLAIALVVAVVATTLEAFSKYGIDNLTVPLVSAAVAFWLGQRL